VGRTQYRWQWMGLWIRFIGFELGRTAREHRFRVYQSAMISQRIGILRA
jgi:hypothetical protein